MVSGLTQLGREETHPFWQQRRRSVDWETDSRITRSIDFMVHLSAEN